MAYVLERTHAAGTVYAMTLDDLDICQMLPVRGDQFDQGVSIHLYLLRICLSLPCLCEVCNVLIAVCL